ncbi:Ras-related protein [Acrasis kona]|uniref:Ras-related protein n=1 Tax=Acrasis kona TaxID=1008807 RepID=A0AAW2Z0W7_9EUKA
MSNDNMSNKRKSVATLDVNTNYTKILVVGAPHSGKSKLIEKYSRTNNIELKPRVNESTDSVTYFTKVITKAVSLTEISSNSLQLPHHIRESEGFIFVYDLTSVTSFQELIKLKPLLYKNFPSTRIPLIIVGTNSELSHENAFDNKEIIDAMSNFMDDNYTVPHFEVKDDETVFCAFVSIINEIEDVHKQHAEPELNGKQKHKSSDTLKNKRISEAFKRLSLFFKK